MTVVAAACGEVTPDSSPSGSSRQLGDTTFVSSSAPQRGTASLREVARIGMIDGPPEYLLGRFPTFAIGPDGSLFVADGQLRHYDADGRYVRTIARRGQGPGGSEGRGRHGRLRRRTAGRAGLRQSTRQRLFARRQPRPGDQTQSIGGKTRVRAGRHPMGRRGSAVDCAQPTPEWPGHARRGPAETAVRPPDRPRGSDGYRVPSDSSLGGL